MLHVTTRKLLQVSLRAAIIHIGKRQGVNWEQINIFVPNALILWHMRTCSCALKTHCLSVEKTHKAQSGAPHLVHGTSSVVSPLRVWAPVRAPRSSAEEWSPAEAEFTESRSRGFTTPLGQTRIEKEREGERERERSPTNAPADLCSLQEN